MKIPEDAEYPTSMIVVGQFLDNVLKTHSLSPMSSVKCVSSYSHQRELSQPLYCCPAYSKTEVVCLIVGLFCGIPESYQVLRCHASTTEEELTLFLKRLRVHKAHYLVLNVNKLSFKVQEVY